VQRGSSLIKTKTESMKNVFYLTIACAACVIALFLFPRDNKVKLTSTQFLMEVHDDGYHIYCDEGDVGFIPFTNSALDSLMVDYFE
jgi:hypothetical protein